MSTADEYNELLEERKEFLAANLASDELLDVILEQEKILLTLWFDPDDADAWDRVGVVKEDFKDWNLSRES